MGWDRVDGWTDFVEKAKLFGSFNRKHGSTVLFRGQPRSEWPLQPSLNRLFPEGILERDALAWEAESIQAFQVHVEEARPQRLLADMQHFGAPTRLLDWSKSMFVAAYFAVSSEFEADGAVWIAAVEGDSFLADEILRYFNLPSEAPNAPRDEVCVIEVAAAQPDRMLAQQACFTMAGRILSEHESLIRKRGVLERVTIPSHLKRECLAHLRDMNITANALFPGLDGIGKSIKELLELRRVDVE